MKKTKFLWLLTDEKFRVSTDRSLRFRSGRKEVNIARVITEDFFYKNTALVHGEIVCVKSSLKANVCIIGQIINFKYSDETSKRDKKFPFSYAILEINKSISMRLSPCAYITKRGKLNICNIKYIHISNYMLSVKQNCIELSGASISQRMLTLLKEKIKTC